MQDVIDSVKYAVSTADTFDVVVGVGLVFASIASVLIVFGSIFHL